MIVNTKKGGTIADGIIITARDANGYSTEAELYASDGIIHPYMFYYNGGNTIWKSLSKLTIKSPITKIKDYGLGNKNGLVITPSSWADTITELSTSALYHLQLTPSSLTLPALVSLNNPAPFDFCDIAAVNLPLVANLPYQCFYGATINTLTVGSVGHAVTDIHRNCFERNNMGSATVTIYTMGSYVDTALTNMRANGTRQTFIIKASHSTSYNGVSYAAGDTMLTDAPSS